MKKSLIALTLVAGFASAAFAQGNAQNTPSPVSATPVSAATAAPTVSTKAGTPEVVKASPKVTTKATTATTTVAPTAPSAPSAPSASVKTPAVTAAVSPAAAPATTK